MQVWSTEGRAKKVSRKPYLRRASYHRSRLKNSNATFGAEQLELRQDFTTTLRTLSPSAPPKELPAPSPKGVQDMERGIAPLEKPSEDSLVRDTKLANTPVNAYIRLRGLAVYRLISECGTVKTYRVPSSPLVRFSSPPN